MGGARVNWPIAYLNQLQQQGKITGYTILNDKLDKLEITTPKTKKKGKGVKDKPMALKRMELVLHQMGLEYVSEHKFHPTRRFKFDIALEQYKVAIEYEGLMSDKSRHTTVTGYTKDASKYNLAQSMGWTVLRYTVLNHWELATDLKKLIESKNATENV